MANAPAISQSASPAAPAPAPARRRSSFHELLSELNPLQYIPVIGTIYRAATGDTIPETAREVGSLVVSGLTSGPIGIAANLGLLAAERVTGIDPEKIGRSVLADIGIAGTAAPAQSAAMATVVLPPSAPVSKGASVAVAWSPAQLTAYGVTTNADGALDRGELHGSDVLNDMELAQLKSTVPV